MGFSELLYFILFGVIFLSSTPKMCIKTPLPGKGIGVFSLLLSVSPTAQGNRVIR